jgi:hypothetical protein
MNTKELLTSWELELGKLSKNLYNNIQINDENTDDEEFYFFIRKDLPICFYAFNDNWGFGIGIHFQENKTGMLWYIEEFGITDSDKQLTCIFDILKSVAREEKIFYTTEKNNIEIDINIFFSTKNIITEVPRLSLTELNKEFAAK